MLFSWNVSFAANVSFTKPFDGSADACFFRLSRLTLLSWRSRQKTNKKQHVEMNWSGQQQVFEPGPLSQAAAFLTSPPLPRPVIK